MRDETTPEDVDELHGRPPGRDDSDPYAERDIRDLPRWWQKAIAEYEEYNLRPFRPPRFVDGVLKRDVIDRLEREFDVTIRLICYEPDRTAVWHILVDWEEVGTVTRNRSVDGYSIYGMESGKFEQLVRSEIQSA